MSIYEIQLPVVDATGAAFDTNLFRVAFDELADQFGIVDTWPVYRPRRTPGGTVVEEEYYRYRLEVADTADNHLWLAHWRERQESQFACPLWMVRCRK